MLHVHSNHDPLSSNPNVGKQAKHSLVDYLDPRSSTQPYRAPSHLEFLYKLLLREHPSVGFGVSDGAHGQDQVKDNNVPLEESLEKIKEVIQEDSIPKGLSRRCSACF